MAKKNVYVIDGTSQNAFTIGPQGAVPSGVRLKNNSNNLDVKNIGDSAFINVTAAQFLATGDTGLVLNSDAAGAGADWKISLARPTSGMTADWTLTFPINPGSAGQVLATDGSGNTSWVSAASTSACLTLDTTTVNFGSSSTISAFTLPANALVVWVKVYIVTAFDDVPTLSVGISGNASKYMGTSMNSLTADAKSVFTNEPGEDPVGTTEAIEIAYSAAAATVGQAKVVVAYSVPA